MRRKPARGAKAVADQHEPEEQQELPASDRVQMIIEAEQEADQALQDVDQDDQQIADLRERRKKNRRRHEENQWLAAELISAELEDGKTQVQLAKEIGKSRAHVQRMAKCWKLHPRVQGRPAFNEVYHSPEVRGTPKPKQPQDVPDVHVDADPAGVPGVTVQEPEPAPESRPRAKAPVEAPGADDNHRRKAPQPGQSEPQPVPAEVEPDYGVSDEDAALAFNSWWNLMQSSEEVRDLIRLTHEAPEEIAEIRADLAQNLKEILSWL